MTINEVAPPGYGHTKGDKEKGVKRGGTAAAFDRARKEGRFKGSKSDMFAIMWSQKNKGDKPHYKPGTNKKYKKYQEESAVLDEVSKELALKAYAKRVKRIHDTADNDDEKEMDRQTTKSGKFKDDETKRRIEKKHGKDKKTDYAMGRAIYKANLGNQVGDRNEEVAMPHVSSKDKKAMAKRAKNLFTKDEEGTKQGVNEKTTMKDNNLFGDAYAGSYEKLKKKIGSKKMHTKPAIEENKFVDAMVSAVKKRKEEKKPEKAMDAGAKARRMLKRREHAKYVSGSEDNVPDDIREGSLHKWFKGSKSKDGKGGWVNVKTGGTCASDEPGEGTPKCVSSSKRASMTKAERDSASRRKLSLIHI